MPQVNRRSSPHPGTEGLWAVDQLCERFEAELLAGRGPRIEDWLDGGPDAEHGLLLAELLAIEVHYEHERGREPDLAAYLKRFPGDGETVTSVLGAGAPPAAPIAPRLSEGDRVGSYLIQGLIGEGGMGTVYRARHGALERDVALKVMAHGAPGSSALDRRFRQEARAIARLHHGNIVPVFEQGQADGVSYFAMQLIEGTSLDRIIANRRDGADGPKPPLDRQRDAAEQLAPIARALHYAHGRGVVHRDVKPSNIIVDEAGAPWIVDFGVARIEGHDMTAATDLVGTLRYMPPEQLDGPTDARGDIYSLGVTLFEAIAHRPAVEGSSAAEILDRLARGTVPSLGRVTGGVSPDLETVVRCATDRDPSRRYPTAAAFALDLERFVRGEPVEARRAPVPERALRWVRRNPWPAGALALALLVSATAVIAAGVFRSQATRITNLSANVGDLLDESEVAREDLRRSLYRADMQRGTLEALQIGSAAQLPGFLPRWEPDGDSPDLRGWEWYFLRSLVGANGPTIWDEHRAGHTVDWNQSRSLLAAGGASGTAFRSLNDLSVVVDVLDGAHARIVRFDRSGDLAAVVDMHGVRVWDLVRGEQTLTRPELGYGDVAWVGQTGAMAIGSAQPVLWDATSDHSEPISGVPSTARTLAVSRDGALHALTDQHQIHVHDLEAGRVVRTIRGSRFVEAAEFSPTGHRLAVPCRALRIHVFDLDSAETMVIDGAHDDVINRVRWSADGRLLVSASADSTVKTWDAETGRLVQAFLGHTADVAEACFLDDDRRVASTSRAGDLRLWKTEAVPAHRVDAPWVPGQGLSRPTLHWSLDGEFLYVSCTRGTRALKAADPTARWEDRPYGRMARHSPDGSHVFHVQGDRICVTNLSTGTDLDLLSGAFPDLPEHRSYHNHVRWTPDSRAIYLSMGPELHIVTVASGGFHIDTQPMEPIYERFDMHPSGETVVAQHGASVSIRDAATGAILTRAPAHLFDVSGKSYTHPSYSPNGSNVAVIHGPRVLILEAQDLAEIAQLEEHGATVEELSWSQDMARIATACGDGNVRVFDPEEGLMATLPCDLPVWRVAWSPDGLTLAALDQGGFVHIWSARDAWEHGTASERAAQGAAGGKR